MYKTVNGHGPEIRKEAFLDISSIHEHATRSAVKGDLFVPRKTTSIAQQAVSVAGPRLWNMIPSTIRNAHDTLYNKEYLQSQTQRTLSKHTEGTGIVQLFIFLLDFLLSSGLSHHFEHTLVYL